MIKRLLRTACHATKTITLSTTPLIKTTKNELQSHWTWLHSEAPCFPVKADAITIIQTPTEFHHHLKQGCATSTQRVVLASLYLGTGHLEQALVQSLVENDSFKRGDLKVSILLDYTRSSRLSPAKTSSRTVLAPLVGQRNAQIHLYHTPALKGVVRRLLPERFNELIGLQHIKLYIFDDKLLISGANLSHDYFTNRQDRYYLIEDRRLCDFYTGLVNCIQKFSVCLNSDVESADKNLSENFVKNAHDSISSYLKSHLKHSSSALESESDTLVFPLVQMGQLGITQDSRVTSKLLENAPENATLQFATGYFNLTQTYERAILNSKSHSSFQFLMSHPICNGFWGAKGIAGQIPNAYTLLARKFAEKIRKYSEKNIKMFEYIREGWTYHGKGLWCYPDKGSVTPTMTLIGSPNFGCRSEFRDLETQLVILTSNEELRQKMHAECEFLFKYAVPGDFERNIPKWVQIVVYLFKGYF